jgi:DNA polymerase-4
VCAVCEHTFVSSDPTILHADLDAFYASVEQRDNPHLRGRPVIVGGGGVVLAASYEAKAYGVVTAMGGARARRLCPHAVVVAPRMSAYAEASKAVFEVFDQTTPLVEALSIDEAFLDVRGFRRLAGTPTEMAVRLREAVLREVGLPITVGVARTKFLAKVASGVAKPDGLLVVPPGRELTFLHALPVERLWGVGTVTAGKLRSRGIKTVGQVARLDEALLVAMLGRASGRHLHALAHNRDPRPVQARRRRRSIGAQRALGRRARSRDEIDATVIALVDRVARRLRAAGRVCRTVVLRLRFADFSRATRSHTLPHATACTHEILATAKGLLAAAMPTIERQGLTLVGVALTNLEDDAAVQLALPFDGRLDGALDAALDGVRERFGTAAVTRAVLLGRRPDLEMPLLPD